MVVDAKDRGSEHQELRYYKEHVRSDVVLFADEKRCKRQSSSYDKRSCRNPLFQDTFFVHSCKFYTWNSLNLMGVVVDVGNCNKPVTKLYIPPSK